MNELITPHLFIKRRASYSVHSKPLRGLPKFNPRSKPVILTNQQIPRSPYLHSGSVKIGKHNEIYPLQGNTHWIKHRDSIPPKLGSVNVHVFISNNKLSSDKKIKANENFNNTDIIPVKSIISSKNSIKGIRLHNMSVDNLHKKLISQEFNLNMIKRKQSEMKLKISQIPIKEVKKNKIKVFLDSFSRRNSEARPLKQLNNSMKIPSYFKLPTTKFNMLQQTQKIPITQSMDNSIEDMHTSLVQCYQRINKLLANVEVGVD